MKILEARRADLLREMNRGKGGDKILPFPVKLEPFFTPFRQSRQMNQNNMEVREPQPEPWEPPSIDKLTYLRIRISPADDYNQAIAEQFLLALGSEKTISFEVIRSAGKTALQTVVSNTDSTHALSQIRSHYPKASVSEEKDLLIEFNSNNMAARSYRLRESHLFRIRSKHEAEVYASLAGVSSAANNREFSILQVLFQKVQNLWRGNSLSMATDPWDPSKSSVVDIPDLNKKAQDKVKKPLFAVSVSLIAPNPELVKRLEMAFVSQFDSDDNGFVPVAPFYPVRAILGRYTQTPGMILNAEELLALAHLPDPKLLRDDRLELARTTAVAPALATGREIYLGVNRHQGRETPVGITDDWLTRHLSAFGSTGYGKTTLLKNLFLSLMRRGHGFAFIDPAGDAATELLDLVPENRVGDIIYFNPGDRDYPPALNVLKSSLQEQEKLASELMVGLKRIFRGHSVFGPRTEWLTRQAIRTLLAHPQEKNLNDIPRLLSDEMYRNQVLNSINDPDLKFFWSSRNQFAASVIDPILARLSAFLDRPTIRNIVSQSNLIDFHQIMRDNKILICNLSKGILGEEHSTLLGSFILSKLQLAAMARAEIPHHERRLFVVAADEIHNWVGSDSDTANIRNFLSEARQYAVSLVTATQFTSQIDRDVLTAIFGNVGTLVCFRCGIVDAPILQRELGVFTTDDLLNLEPGKAIVRMGRAGAAFNLDIPAIQTPRVSFKAKIIRLSRERYCRKRSEVEAQLTRPSTDKVVIGATRHIEQYDPVELAFLERVAKHPDDAVTAICSALDLSGSKSSRIRKELCRKGLLTEVETRLGRKGRRAIYAVPTFKGYQAIGESPPRGRGGSVHKHFVEVIARWAMQKGYQIAKEYKLEEGWVDLVLSRDGQATAIELSVTSTAEREMNNMNKCLEAGYPRVVMLFLDRGVQQRYLNQVNELFPGEERKKVIVGNINDFHEVI
jgi:hypothetical protein